MPTPTTYARLILGINHTGNFGPLRYESFAVDHALATGYYQWGHAALAVVWRGELGESIIHWDALPEVDKNRIEAMYVRNRDGLVFLAPLAGEGLGAPSPEAPSALP